MEIKNNYQKLEKEEEGYIWTDSLDSTVKEASLKAHFPRYGPISKIWIHRENRTGEMGSYIVLKAPKSTITKIMAKDHYYQGTKVSF